MSGLPLGKKIAVIAGGVVLVLILAVAIANPRITAWAESDKFRDLLNRETSKGLKLQAQYAPITRVGFLGMKTDSFSGDQGSRTIVSLQAYGISGVFNPLGFFLQRWEIDSIHIGSGSVMLQKTNGSGSKGPSSRPWWGWFWPYRVHLADVKVDDANILWHLKDKESGIYDTFLEITPNGRDFEYDARGGVFAAPMTPKLLVEHAHMLIRKPRLYCPEFILGDDAAHPEKRVTISGEAGLQDDRSMKLKADAEALTLAPWLPQGLRAHVLGTISGHFDYQSTGTGLETGQGQGSFTVNGGVLHNLAAIHTYVTVTRSPDPGDVVLKVCRADLHWKQGALTADNLEVECEGVFRLTGTLTVAKDQTLSGTLELGLTDPYLQWLPTAKTAIFTREEGPYHFTTVQMSGTAKKPQQDLAARVTHEVAKSPLLALKLFFNQASDWFNFD